MKMKKTKTLCVVASAILSSLLITCLVAPLVALFAWLVLPLLRQWIPPFMLPPWLRVVSYLALGWFGWCFIRYSIHVIVDCYRGFFHNCYRPPQKAERAGIPPAMQEAQEWFIKLVCAVRVEDLYPEFASWLEADPAHRRAYRCMEHLWGLMRIANQPREPPLNLPR